jgi:hypothetical protein
MDIEPAKRSRLMGNQWVWTLSFRVHQQNIEAFLKAREAA